MNGPFAHPETSENSGSDRATSGGIWISTDGGKSWRNILSRDPFIYDITIDPRNPKSCTPLDSPRRPGALRIGARGGGASVDCQL